MKPIDYIPNPCSENWDEMSGDERKKFCDKCSTTVHDLTEMSGDEISALKQVNGGKLCGMFDHTRLRNSIMLSAGIGTLALSACKLNEDADTSQQDQSNPFIHKPGHPQVLGEICLPPPPVSE